MHDTVVDIALWVIGAAFSAIGWVITMIFGKLNTQAEKHMELANEFHSHETKVAETYSTKADLKDSISEVKALLIRIENKIDAKGTKQ